MKEAFKEANKVFGDIRTYVNCAGTVGKDTMINERGTHDSDLFRKVVDVNLFGSFLCTTLAAWHLKNLPLDGKERGVIINIDSVIRRYGTFDLSAYSASKGGLHAMLLPIARELGRHKIRLMNIAPGLMKTPMCDTLS